MQSIIQHLIVGKWIHAKAQLIRAGWIIVKGKVFDVTKFLADHPGGKKVLLKVAGKDATKEFESLHSAGVLKKYSPSLCIGELNVCLLNVRISQLTGSLRTIRAHNQQAMEMTAIVLVRWFRLVILVGIKTGISHITTTVTVDLERRLEHS